MCPTKTWNIKAKYEFKAVLNFVIQAKTLNSTHNWQEGGGAGGGWWVERVGRVNGEWMRGGGWCKWQQNLQSAN